MIASISVRFLRTLVIFIQFQTIFGDLEGEMMKISQLNPELDPGKLKIFECPEGHECQVGQLNREPTCVERRRFHGLGQNSTDKYVVVVGETGRSVQLECHYCNENDDTVPKVWYYYEKFLASKRFLPVPLHLAYPPETRKFIVDENDHRLTIRNFTEADGALYFCQGLDDNSPKFNYLVDAVGDSGDLEPKRGSFEDYLKFHSEFLSPLNKKLVEEYKNDLKNWFDVKSNAYNYNVSHQWSNWGKCHVCGREHGVLMRTGTCQLNIPTLGSTSSGDKRGRSAAMDFGYKFSCHSTMLKRFLTSKLRQAVNSIPDFIEELPCDGQCTLAGLGAANTAELLGSDANVELPDVVTVLGTLGESVTLLCADDPVADVVWLKDNEILSLSGGRSMDRRSRVVYTRNRGGIRFQSLNESDGGSYTCIFDDLVKMIFKLETQTPVTETPIPEAWIWMNLGVFSVVCVLIWILLIIIISRVSWRTRSGYQALSDAEETFLQRKHALMEGHEQGPSVVDV